MSNLPKQKQKREICCWFSSPFSWSFLSGIMAQVLVRQGHPWRHFWRNIQILWHFIQTRPRRMGAACRFPQKIISDSWLFAKQQSDITMMMMMMMMMMKTYDHDLAVNHNQQNHHNQPVMSQVSPTSLAPLEVSNRSSFHSSLPNFPPHLPDFPLCLGEKTENSCCVLFGGKGEGLFQKMYVLYYTVDMSPFFFNNLECTKKKVRIRISFFAPCYFHHSSLFQLILLNSSGVFWWSHGTRRVKQGLIIYWTKVCFFFQGEKNELKV